MRRHGFSMTDLLAMVCVVALATAVLMPAIKRNRDVSLFQLSQARLAASAQAQLQYAANSNDRLQFPWAPQSSGFPGWTGFLAHDNNYYWRFRSGNPGYTVDIAGAFQYWILRYIGVFDKPISPGSVSPADAELLRSWKARETLAIPNASELYATMTSYWLSPTVWFNDARYSTSTRADPASANQRRSTIADVRSPDSKVLLFERYGFFDANRNVVAAAPPVWCTPSARPNVAMFDGSVRHVNTADLQLLATSTNTSVRDTFRPSGTWRPTTTVGEFGLESRMVVQATTYAFFWATRNGLAGRDIDRTGLARQAESERLMRFKAIGSVAAEPSSSR